MKGCLVLACKFCHNDEFTVHTYKNGKTKITCNKCKVSYTDSSEMDYKIVTKITRKAEV